MPRVELPGDQAKLLAGDAICICLPRAGDHKRVDHNGPARTEAVNAPDPLLEIHWVPGHVQMEQAAGHLQINALTAGAGGHEESRATPVAEPRDLLVALGIGLPTDDDGGALAEFHLDLARDNGDGFNGLAEQHDFFAAGRSEQFRHRPPLCGVAACALEPCAAAENFAE